nr:LuxR C-terminal-related transcriptional regulator [uncultured Sphingomonas sp.]
MLVTDDIIAAVRVGNVGDIRRAAEALRDAVRDIAGLKVAVTDNIASAKPMRDADGAVLASEVFGADADHSWWTMPHLALTSPLPMACRFESEPFWCNAAGFHTRSANPLLGTIDLSRFRERALTSAAIVAPIHLPFGQIGAASFLSPDLEAEDLSAEFDAHSDVLSLLARIFVASFVKATERRPADIGAIMLSKREVECLRWAAAGKTNDEIAIILGLKRTTIRFHIRTAAQKLNAVNRDQALFKAAQLGFLGTLR